MEASDAAPVQGKCRDWKALLGPGVLVVDGWCTFPSAGWMTELRKIEPQGDQPQGPAARARHDGARGLPAAGRARHRGPLREGDATSSTRPSRSMPDGLTLEVDRRTGRDAPAPARPQAINSLGPVSDGVLLIDKPAGKTSHDIVAAVRREHRGRRVGHAGTLDPVRDRAAARPRRPRDAHPALPHGAAQALRDRRAARRDVDDRRPRRRDHGRPAGSRPTRSCCRPASCCSARTPTAR